MTVLPLSKVFHEEEVLSGVTVGDLLSGEDSIQVKDAVDDELCWIAFYVTDCCLEYFHLCHVGETGHEKFPLLRVVLQSVSFCENRPCEVGYCRLVPTKEYLTRICRKDNFSSWNRTFEVPLEFFKGALIHVDLRKGRVNIFAPILTLQKGENPLCNLDNFRFKGCLHAPQVDNHAEHSLNLRVRVVVGVNFGDSARVPDFLGIGETLVVE